MILTGCGLKSHSADLDDPPVFCLDSTLVLFLLRVAPAVNLLARSSSSYEFVRPRSELEGCINFNTHLRGLFKVTVAEAKAVKLELLMI